MFFLTFSYYIAILYLQNIEVTISVKNFHLFQLLKIVSLYFH